MKLLELLFFWKRKRCRHCGRRLIGYPVYLVIFYCCNRCDKYYFAWCDGTDFHEVNINECLDKYVPTVFHSTVRANLHHKGIRR